MDPVYVFGHKNPDTDSIVSAMAYAALRNSLGDREYTAVRLGSVSDETQSVLDRFGFSAPPLISNVRTQVRDLDFDRPPILSGAVTVQQAWELLQKNDGISALPMADDDAHLIGMLSPGDIAAYDIHCIDNPNLDALPLFNLLSTLEGTCINDAANLVDTISGRLVIALPTAYGAPAFEPGCVALCGQQSEYVRLAIEKGASCIVLSQAEASEDLRSVSKGPCIITTPYDAARASRMLFHALPAHRLCSNQQIIAFHLDDYLDDVREVILQSRYRSYPVLDAEDHVIGTLSRYHIIRPKHKRVVLVDHNEEGQSVTGLEQADILEIIDHHRLSAPQTGSPIYFRNEPVGSTATIIASMYQDRGLMPSPKLAGLIAAAIVSDTVMFKSPTCTPRDIHLAERMARIADLNLEDLGHDIFSSSSTGNKTAGELLVTDFKEFHIAGHALGISQITCTNSEQLLERKDELLKGMQSLCKEHHYDLYLLMLTDVLRSGTQLVFLGDEDAIGQAFNVNTKANTVFLPGVLSRKKQVVPALSALWG